jgi:hypothetical protein
MRLGRIWRRTHPHLARRPDRSLSRLAWALVDQVTQALSRWGLEQGCTVAGMAVDGNGGGRWPVLDSCPRPTTLPYPTNSKRLVVEEVENLPSELGTSHICYYVNMPNRPILPVTFILLANCSDRAVKDQQHVGAVVEDQREVALPVEESGRYPTPPTSPKTSGSTLGLDSEGPAAVQRSPGRLTGPADVQFSSGDYNFAYLKLDEQVLLLEPYVVLRLSPGRHELAVRTDTKDAWERLQPLELAPGPGRRYEVRLSRTKGWSLVDEGPIQEVVQPTEQPAHEIPAEQPANEPSLDPLPFVPSTSNPVDSPIVGYWRETARIPCDGGPAFVPEDPIREFVVWAAGAIRVTWRPFETYHDYHGDYQLDLDKQLINISNLDGNYVPTDIDHRGRFVMQKHTLILEDMWLGSSRDGRQPPACGRRFEPTSP